jgi:hypothetical protein
VSFTLQITPPRDLSTTDVRVKVLLLAATEGRVAAGLFILAAKRNPECRSRAECCGHARSVDSRYFSAACFFIACGVKNDAVSRQKKYPNAGLVQKFQTKRPRP